jgi:hypothetical protein
LESPKSIYINATDLSSFRINEKKKLSEEFDKMNKKRKKFLEELSEETEEFEIQKIENKLDKKEISELTKLINIEKETQKKLRLNIKV